MSSRRNLEVSSFTSLMRALFLIAVSLLGAAILAPFAFQLSQSVSFFSKYEFSSVFNRVAQILVIALMIAGWRWMGFRMNIRPMLRREDLRANCLNWFVLGFLCILLLVLVQYSVELRILRDLEYRSLPGKFAKALLTAVTVGLMEEIVFRGFILQALLQRVQVFWAIFSGSFLFAFVHLFSLDHMRDAVKHASFDTDSLTAGFAYAGTLLAPLKNPVSVVPGLFGLFLTGWLLAELVIRSRSLWPAVGMHAGWVLGIQFLNRIWKFRPGPDAAPLWLFGEKFAATGVFGWVVLLVLILVVRRRLPMPE